MKTFRRIFILTPSQSRRIIARGLVQLPEVKKALTEGKIFIGRGSTNAYILEEMYKVIQHDEKFNKGDFVAGQIVPGDKFGKWWINKGNSYPEILIDKGKVIHVEDRVKAVSKFEPDDLIIKGGNALDIHGIPGVLLGGQGGGTIGSLLGPITSLGLTVICPIGLEKTVFTDISQIHEIMGMRNMEHPSEGIPCGIVPMPFATAFTEIEAIETLFDCEAFQVAAGGVGGAEGCVSILINAFDEEEMQIIDSFMQDISGEPPYQPNLDKSTNN